METRLTYKKGFPNHPIFEVMATTNTDNTPNWYAAFEDNIYLSKMTYPIGDKKYRLVGLHGKIQDAFIKTFGKDMLFLKNEKEIEQTLKQVIITMKYKVGLYNIVK